MSRVRAPKLPLLETLIFAGGLIAAVATGVAAYNRYGLYGDGPGGAGFSRATDPVSDERLLVQHVMTSQGRVRRIFGPDGGLMEAELDRNADGNADECIRIRNGQAGIGFSRAGNGVIDAWTYRNDQGQTVRIEVSTRQDHRVDRWEFYSDGALTRVAIDADGDGKPDTRR